MAIPDEKLAAFAELLEANGFTVYASTNGSQGNYFRYSRVVDSQQCFGYVQRDWQHKDRYVHTMPIRPSIEHGSSMWVEGVEDQLTLGAARRIARPANRNPVVGQQANYDDPRFRHLYRDRRGMLQNATGEEDAP